MPVNSWIRFWIRSRNHMQPGNRYFPLRLGTRIFPAAGGICFSWGIPYSYYWFPRRFPRSSLGFGYIHRTHSNHPFSSQNRVGLKVYRPTPQLRKTDRRIPNKILEPRHAPVQNIFTECDDRHFWLSWCDPGDPILRTHRKLMLSSGPTPH